MSKYENPGMRQVVESNEYLYANVARMDRQTIHVIVEGKDDKKFFQSLLNTDVCNIGYAEGKYKVIQRIQRYSSPKAIAIIDADYAPLTLKDYPYPNNVFTTDAHSVETMIISSGALKKILINWGDESKVEAFEKKYGLTVREAIVKIALPIGLLRWFNDANDLYLNFDSLDITQFIDQQKWLLEEEAFIKAICDGSKSLHMSPQELLDKWRKFYKKHSDINVWKICHGHDVTKILLLLLQTHIGDRFMPYRHFKQLEALLRSTYDFIYFMRTDLYLSLKAWESRMGGKYQIVEVITAS